MPESTAVTDAILSAPVGSRPLDILNAMSEVRTIAGFKFLTRSERRKRDIRRSKFRRQDPAAARAKRASFRRSKVRIQQGLRRFRKSAKGKRFAKAKVKARKQLVAWIDVDRLPAIVEDNLDLTPFYELHALADQFASPTRTQAYQGMCDELIEFVRDYPELLADTEIEDFYETMADYATEHLPTPTEE